MTVQELELYLAVANRRASFALCLMLTTVTIVLVVGLNYCINNQTFASVDGVRDLGVLRMIVSQSLTNTSPILYTRPML